MIIVVGAGLAGLTAAKVLRQRNLPVTILEASDGLGGRVRSDYQDGYTLDRGFQVFFTAYPAARRHLDFSRLDFREFDPGGIITQAGKRTVLADPLRRPQFALAAIASDAVTTTDKLKVAQLTAELRGRSPEQVDAQRDFVSTLAYLKEYGFSDKFIANFAQPFFGGVFLERNLHTSARVFRFDYKMLAEGRTVLPARGMQAIPDQLAEASVGHIRLLTRVAELLREGGRVVGVRTASGEEIEAEAVIVATDALTASKLTGLSLPSQHVSAACVYFASDRSLYAEKMIILNANGDVFVNNAQQVTNVAPEYAPPRKHLISCAIVGLPTLSDAEMFARAKQDMARWFDDVDAVAALQPLKVQRIEFAQFYQPPGIKATLPANFSGTAGLYFAAEFTTFSSINGAMRSGEQAAAAIIAHRSGVGSLPSPPASLRKWARGEDALTLNLSSNMGERSLIMGGVARAL